MNSMIKIIREQLANVYLITRLSVYEVKSTNNNNHLGMIWEILNPLIQLSVYWFVFGMGIRGGGDVNGFPFVLWLSAGFSIWIFINAATIQGSKSIYTRINLISKMNFPMSAIPSYVILSVFYQHLAVIGIVVVMFFMSGYGLSIHFLQIFYYMFATFMFIFSFSLISSTLSTIVRDFQMIVQAVFRMLLYITPILWTPEKLPLILQKIMSLNPLTYLVEGYRQCFLGTGYFFNEPLYALYFWSIVSGMFLVGSIIHMKFRNRFADYV